MTKRAQAKYKIDRRMGENIWGRPRSPFNKREYGPGQHGQRRKGKATDFGTQLKAKQKVKGYYGNISERQFHSYYVEALRLKGDSSANLIGLLERRLDALIYRAKCLWCSKRTRWPSGTCPTMSKSITPRARPNSLAFQGSRRCRIRRIWSRTWSSSSTRADDWLGVRGSEPRCHLAPARALGA